MIFIFTIEVTNKAYSQLLCKEQVYISGHPLHKWVVIILYQKEGGCFEKKKVKWK